MRIIIDTNLWISFMLGRKIATMRTLLTHPSLEIYVCRELLDEFYDVSSREKIRKYIRPEDRSTVVGRKLPFIMRALFIY